MYRGFDFLGRSGAPCRFSVDTESRLVEFVFKFEGHHPTTRSIPVNDLIVQSQYPPSDQSPIELQPKSFLGLLWRWLKTYPFFFTTFVLLAALLVQQWRSKKREADVVGAMADDLKSLLEGSRAIHSCESEPALWNTLLEVSASIFPGKATLFDGHDVLPSDPNLNLSYLKSLCETLEAGPQSAMVSDFRGHQLSAPRNDVSSALLAECRPGGENSRVLLLLAEQPQAYNQRHQELFLLLCYQVTTALLNLEFQQQLNQKEKMAALGGMASGLCHELNNPLGALELAVDSSLDLVDSPKMVRMFLNKASGAIARARNINENFLLFSDQATIATDENVDLAELIGQSMTSVEHLLQGIQLESNLEETPLRGSTHLLELMLTNLLLNAKDAVAEQESPRISVSCRNLEDQVEFVIGNNGPAIEPDAKSRIFEPFFTTKPLGKGLGLGLTVCHRVAELHGGSIRVGNNSPQNLEMIVSLPRNQS